MIQSQSCFFCRYVLIYRTTNKLNPLPLAIIAACAGFAWAIYWFYFSPMPAELIGTQGVLLSQLSMEQLVSKAIWVVSGMGPVVAGVLLYMKLKERVTVQRILSMHNYGFSEEEIASKTGVARSYVRLKTEQLTSSDDDNKP